MDFKNFTVSDFICNEHFQDWVIRPDDKTDNFWNNWLEQHPGKKQTVDEARKVLLNIKFKEDIPSSEQVQKALMEHMAKIQSMEVKPMPTLPVFINRNRLRHFSKIAAILTGILLIGSLAFYYNWKYAKTTISTRYGEIKTLMLPDSTEIILNAHSSVTFLKHWPDDRPREVTLQGEAFFKVNHLNKNEQHIKNSQRFIVHTKDIKVEVLGTQFDVRNRRSETNVILKSGKVKIVFNKPTHAEVTMAAGEMITYEANKDQLKRSLTNPEVHTAWIDKKMILEDASVNTIIQFLEDNYGYKIILKDTAIGNKKMEGTLLLDNIDDVFFVLTTSLDIQIQKKDSTLIFSK
jgi:ferric-dicitrate binding protein FerR (iron transport regulator)